MSFEQDLERLRKNDATLTSLNLGYNNLTAEGARHLLEILKTNTSLTTLFLGGEVLKNAFDWFLNAAESGKANAQCILASLYQMGRGTKKNEAKALEWYRKAAAILIDRHFTEEERDALTIPSKETNLSDWKKFFMFEINMKNHQNSLSDEQLQPSFG